MSLVPFKFNPGVEREVLDELLRGSSSSEGVLVGGRGGFYVEEKNDRFVLRNVYVGEEPLRGLWVLGWGKGLLDGGKSHTQDEFVKLTQNVEFKLAPGPLYAASILALYDNQNSSVPGQKDLVHRVKELFKLDFDPQKPYVMTSTRTVWMPSGVDEVRHWGGYSNQRVIRKNIVGPQGCITAGFEDFTEAELGTRDVGKLENALVWLTGKRPYAFRFNAKPKQVAERVLVLGCYVDNFYFNANGGVIDNGPARGLVAVRAQKIE